MLWSTNKQFKVQIWSENNYDTVGHGKFIDMRFLDEENLCASSYTDLLKTNGLKHFRNEINTGLLKIEFMNIHSQFKQERLSELKCFYDILDFFHSMHPYINHRAICPNFWTLIRLVALHVATTSTYYKYSQHYN